MDDSKSIPVFTHIPKTAGTSLNRILEWQYLFKPGKIFAGGGIPYIDHFKNLPIRDKKNIKLVKEHFHFGIHEYWPYPVRYFTMFRDPQKRAISQYHHMLRLYKYYPRYKKLQLRKYSLKEFLQKGIVDELDNCHVRYLCGVSGIPFGGVNDAHLQMAIHNLKKYYLVGITEFFTESVLLFARAFNWTDPYYTKGNVSPVKAEDLAIDEETQLLLDHYNRFDKVLYKTALELFNEQVTAAGPGFKDEVVSFTERNKKRSWTTLAIIHLSAKFRYFNKHHLWNLKQGIKEHLKMR